ncbi:MAG: hypothetical protein GWP06_03380 [Actinobacteria bacterium]|nr:hypothetical protein [Actinomycetota bacterium]
MKHIIRHETLCAILPALIISNLIFAPVFYNASFAQSQDVDPPYIAHQPERMALRNKPMNILANISDESQIQKVTITINRGGKLITGALPEQVSMGKVPVLVQAVKDMDVYAKPSKKAKRRGKILKGEALNVTLVRGQFYRIRTPMDLAGYILAKNVEVISEGNVYGVTIPAQLTDESSISYQITATDVYGNVAKTDAIEVTLVTPQELAQLRSGERKMTHEAAGESRIKSGTPIYVKVMYWTGWALAGGGAYYFYSQRNKTKEEKATVDVVVQWK